MMSKDRRAEGLKIAASMMRRKGMGERVVTAKELVEYAQVLDGYIYDGVVPEDGVLVELTVVA